MLHPLLETIYQYFAIDPHNLSGERFYRIRGASASQFLINLNSTSSYDLYELSGSLLLSVISRMDGYITSAFLDTHSQFLVYEKISTSNTTRAHKHEYFEMVYVADGQLDLMIEGRYHRFSPGEACIINSNARHIEMDTSDYTAIYIGLKSNFLKRSQSLLSAENQESLNLFFRRNQQQTGQVDYLTFRPIDSLTHPLYQEKLEKLIGTLLAELLEQQLGYRDVCGIYIQRVFSMLQSPAQYLCSNTRYQTSFSDSLFERTLAYINTHRYKVTRKELENALHYNGNYISRVFLKNTGQTLAEYIRDICLTEAADLLLNTPDNIRDISKRIGYENKTAFYELFKAKFGVTPQEYRSQKTQAKTFVLRDDEEVRVKNIKLE